MSTHAILRGRSPFLAHALRTSAKTNSLVMIGVRPRFAEAFLDLSCSASLGLRRAIQYPASAKTLVIRPCRRRRGNDQDSRRDRSETDPILQAANWRRGQ